MGRLRLQSRHRLVCGDSTDPAVVARVAYDRADVCFTSPPYNAGDNKLGGNTQMVESKYIGQDDDRSEQDYLDLLQKFTNAALDVCTAAVIDIQQLAGNKRVVLRWLAANADRFVDMAIWDKESAPPQMTDSVLNNQHELLVILAADPLPTRAVPFANWHGTVSTVYKGPPQRDREASKVHAATMPMHLPDFVLRKLCPDAGVVYEPFCGSGTTLICAEQIGKRCFAVELEPAYCDVTVRRYQAMSSEAVVLQETGETFEQRKAAIDGQA